MQNPNSFLFGFKLKELQQVGFKLEETERIKLEWLPAASVLSSSRRRRTGRCSSTHHTGCSSPPRLGCQTTKQCPTGTRTTSTPPYLQEAKRSSVTLRHDTCDGERCWLTSSLCCTQSGSHVPSFPKPPFDPFVFFGATGAVHKGKDVY